MEPVLHHEIMPAWGDPKVLVPYLKEARVKLDEEQGGM